MDGTRRSPISHVVQGIGELLVSFDAPKVMAEEALEKSKDAFDSLESAREDLEELDELLDDDGNFRGSDDALAALRAQFREVTRRFADDHGRIKEDLWRYSRSLERPRPDYRPVVIGASTRRGAPALSAPRGRPGRCARRVARSRHSCRPGARVCRPGGTSR